MNFAGDKAVEVSDPLGRLKSLVVLTMLALCACTPAARPTPAPSSPPTVVGKKLVAFGDSLTEGLGVDEEQAYPAQLQRKLQAEGLEWTVINAGNSGETTSGARSRLDWVLKLQPDAVILEIGGNDGLRGIDPKVTRENIAFMIDTFREKKIPVMLAGMKILANMGPDYTEAFESVYPEIAKEKNVPLIPFFLKGVGGVVELNQEDRVHPTEKGYARVVQGIAPHVIPWLKSLDSATPKK